MKLEELLDSLEKAASEQPKPESGTDKPQVSKELDALLTKEAAAENARKAFEDGEKLAHAVLEKIASETVAAIAASETVEAPKAEDRVAQPEQAPAVEKTAEAKPTEEVKVEETKQEDKDMNKQAETSAKDLAAAILEKLASSQAPMVENTGTPGGHKVHQDVAKDVAQDDAKIMPNPRNGTINQLFDAIVARAKATSGATTYDQVGSGGNSASAEGADMKISGTPSVPPSPDVVEKQAAVQYLVDAGCDWETAVDLVKQAAYEIEQEEIDQVKVAAVNELMKEGMNFDGAVDSVRQAIEDLSKEAK